MTDVDTTLTNTDSQGGILRISAADEAPAANPFAPPPHVEKSLTLAALQRNRQCHTIDSTLQPVLFRIDARGIDPHVRPPNRYTLNIALVIDRSGSMQGQWLEPVKRAVGGVLERLGSTDFISVIAFAETADLILPARHPSKRPEVNDRINRIAAGSVTNFQQGLQLAYQQLSAVKHSASINRLVLITDGGPTAGTKDLGALTAQVVEQKKRGISLSAIGLGDDYDEDLLGTLANRTGGNLYHVRDSGGLNQALATEIETLSRTVAKNLRLRVSLARGVYVRQVYGHPPIYGNRAVEADLSDVAADGGLQSLWVFEISPHYPGRYRVAQADLRYDDLNTGRPERLLADVIYEFTAEPVSLAEEAADGMADFDAEIEIAEAVRDIDKTLLAVRRQNLEAGAVQQELEKVKTTFAKHGRTRELAAVASASAEIDAGGSLVKTLMSTVFHLDQGKTH